MAQNIKYLIEDTTWKIIFSNCQKTEIPILSDWEIDWDIIEEKNIRFRCLVKINRAWKLIYISSLEKHIKSKSIFLWDSEKYEGLIKNIEDNFDYQKKLFDGRIRRLFHNIGSLNATNSQELEKIFPPTLFSEKFNEFLKKAKDLISNKPDEVAISLFKIYKDTEAIKNESIIFKSIEENDISTSFQDHVIYRVILNVLYKFYSDFTEKGIYVDIDDNEDYVRLDYRTFSVILFHLFDNAVKYSMPEEKIKIKFNKNDEGLSIDFEMWSTIMEESELDNIRKEGVRWKEATEKYPNDWDGIWLFYMTKLAELNLFKIEINPGTLHKTYKWINYTDNVFSFFFPKERVIY